MRAQAEFPQLLLGQFSEDHRDVEDVGSKQLLWPGLRGNVLQ